MAIRVILADLSLPEVLTRTIVAARELTQARCGALALVSEVSGACELIAQVDEHAVSCITEPAKHGGVSATMIPEGTAAGRGDAGQPVGTVLEVPILGRAGVMYGNLALTEREGGGDFTPEDEELAGVIAATAAIAIENARLYDEARRRQEWLHASAEISRQLLGSESEALNLIARQAKRLADADAATIVMPTPDRATLTVVVASGAGASELASRTYPMAGTFAELAVELGQPIRIEDGSHGHERRILIAEQIPVGPVLLLPLRGTHGVQGALTVGRLRGRPPFTEADLEMANVFANHAAVALELAAARERQQRMLLLKERDLLASDLHDHVIQRLFAAGLTLQSTAVGLPDGQQAERLTRVVAEFDDTIRQIRTSIFATGGLGDRAITVQTRLLGVIAEAGPLLGFDPEVHFVGPLDTVLSDPVVNDVVAVLREALTNAARHAEASAVRVEVIATSEQLCLNIVDNGVGISSTGRRSGLANLQQRCARHGGEMLLTSAPSDRRRPERRGTNLRWTIPL